MKITYSNSIKDRNDYKVVKAYCVADATEKLNEGESISDLPILFNIERKTGYTDKHFMERAKNVFSMESRILTYFNRRFNDFTLIVVG